MLHALGFTYSEILPLHRWLGVAIVVWSVIHTVAYLLYYIWDGTFSENFNFYDYGRSTMNLMGFVALVSTAVNGCQFPESGCCCKDLLLTTSLCIFLHPQKTISLLC